MASALAVALLALQIIGGSLRVNGAGDGCKGRFYNLRRHVNFPRLPMDTCGENNGDRIVGGQAAALGEFPWMTRIGYKLENCSSPVEYRCGGALITANVVITAAHCTTNLPINQCKSSGTYNTYYPHSVRLGEHLIKSDPDCEQNVCAAKVQDIDIIEVIVHPLYNTPKLRNDIAILKLRRNAIFNGWVNALCLIADSRVTIQRYINQTGIVAGWGIINTKTHELSKKLMKLRIPILPIERCMDAYRDRANLSAREQVCAGGNIGQDSCSGDSGGPLFIIDDYDGGPRYRMLGIVSFGFKKCAVKPLPAVYTNVLYYGKWLMNNIF